jgi:hypothetical protein
MAVSRFRARCSVTRTAPSDIRRRWPVAARSSSWGRVAWAASTSPAGDPPCPVPTPRPGLQGRALRRHPRGEAPVRLLGGRRRELHGRGGAPSRPTRDLTGPGRPWSPARPACAGRGLHGHGGPAMTDLSARGIRHRLGALDHLGRLRRSHRLHRRGLGHPRGRRARPEPRGASPLDAHRSGRAVRAWPHRGQNGPGGDCRAARHGLGGHGLAATQSGPGWATRAADGWPRFVVVGRPARLPRGAGTSHVVATVVSLPRSR